MQAALSGLGWEQYLAMMFGGVGALLLPLSLVFWDRRQRRLRKESPPLKTKLLRPAGHTLAGRFDALWEGLVWQLGLACLAGAIIGAMALPTTSLFYHWAVGRFTFAEILQPRAAGPILACLLFLLGAGLLLFRQTLVLRTTLREARQYQAGLRGEQAVAEALASPDVTRAGYVSFHDVPGDGDWNIDHIAVGPGGVVVLETKARAKRRSINHLKDHEVEFDGRILQFPWGYDDKVVAQVERNAQWVRRFVDGFAPKDLPILPVIVVPGWFVLTRGDFPVKAMNPRYLANSFIPKLKPRLTADQLKGVIRRLDERCRTIEC